jgi:hypothetical protein
MINTQKIIILLSSLIIGGLLIFTAYQNSTKRTFIINRRGISIPITREHKFDSNKFINDTKLYMGIASICVGIYLVSKKTD